MTAVTAHDLALLMDNRIYRGERTHAIFTTPGATGGAALLDKIEQALAQGKLPAKELQEFAALAEEWTALKQDQIHRAADEMGVMDAQQHRAVKNLRLDIAQEIIERSEHTPIRTAGFTSDEDAENWEAEAETRLAECALTGPMTNIPTLLADLAAEARALGQRTRPGRRRVTEQHADPSTETNPR